MNELTELLKHGEDYARELLLTKGERELGPVYFLFDDEENVHLVPCTWANDFEKKLMVSAVRQLGKKVNCSALLFISEGWSSEPNDKGIMPRDNPDRVEVVSIIAVNRTESKAVLFHMVRDQVTKRLIGLELFSELGDSSGPIIEGIVQGGVTLH